MYSQRTLPGHGAGEVGDEEPRALQDRDEDDVPSG